MDAISWNWPADPREPVEKFVGTQSGDTKEAVAALLPFQASFEMTSIRQGLALALPHKLPRPLTAGPLRHSGVVILDPLFDVFRDTDVKASAGLRPEYVDPVWFRTGHK